MLHPIGETFHLDGADFDMKSMRLENRYRGSNPRSPAGNFNESPSQRGARMVHRKTDMPDRNRMQWMEDDNKKKDAETLRNIIFRLSETYKLFNDLKDRRTSPFEQSEWENAIKSCRVAIDFIKGKVDRIGEILK